MVGRCSNDGILLRNLYYGQRTTSTQVNKIISNSEEFLEGNKIT
jgi:hypothetical protein